jgi:hypothetical protein
MTGSDSKSVLSSFCGAPRELVVVLAAAFALFIAVACGALISAEVPRNAPVLFALAFAAPPVLMFGGFLAILRRL